MPSSYPFQIHDIIGLIHECNPYSLLDIGCGRGKYGLLAREYLELWGDGGSRTIDAVEAFPANITPLVKLIYDDVYEGDALDVVPTLPAYDLYLLIDVLEHFTKEDGRKLLAACKGDILIATPKRFTAQDAVGGNEYERHKSFWTTADLREHGAVRSVPNDRSLIALVRKEEA